MTTIPVGAALKQREQQYVARRETNGTWYVLDTWNTALETLGPDDELDVKSPALTTLTEGAFLALMKEATSVGIIAHILPADGVSPEEVQDLKQENRLLKQQIEALEHRSFITRIRRALLRFLVTSDDKKVLNI